MTKQEVKDWMIKTLIDKFGLFELEIKDESTLEDLNVDSLEKIELVMEIEEHFGIANINDEDVQMGITIEGIVQLVYDLQKDKNH